MTARLACATGVDGGRQTLADARAASLRCRARSASTARPSSPAVVRASASVPVAADPARQEVAATVAQSRSTRARGLRPSFLNVVTLRLYARALRAATVRVMSTRV